MIFEEVHVEAQYEIDHFSHRVGAILYLIFFAINPYIHRKINAKRLSLCFDKDMDKLVRRTR